MNASASLVPCKICGTDSCATCAVCKERVCNRHMVIGIGDESRWPGWRFLHPVGESTPTGIELHDAYRDGPPRCTTCRILDVREANIRRQESNEARIVQVRQALELAQTRADIEEVARMMKMHADAERAGTEVMDLVGVVGAELAQLSIGRCLATLRSRHELVEVVVEDSLATVFSKPHVSEKSRTPVWHLELRTHREVAGNEVGYVYHSTPFLVDATGRCWEYARLSRKFRSILEREPSGGYVCCVKTGVSDFVVKQKVPSKRHGTHLEWRWTADVVLPGSLTGEFFTSLDERAVLIR